MHVGHFRGPYCQSCCKPLEKPSDFGSEKNGEKCFDYCRYCYQNGEFTEPNITMEEVTTRTIAVMHSMKIPEDVIEKVRKFIPTLKRWKKSV